MTNKVSMENSLSGATAIFELMGLQFFSVSHESLQEGFHSSQQVSKKHKFLFLIIILTSSLQGAGIVYAISLDSHHQQNDNVRTSLTVQFISYTLMVAIILISVLLALHKRKNTKKIFCNFKKIFKIFINELDEKIDYANIARRSKLTFIKTTIFFVFQIVVVLVFVHQHNQSNFFLWAVLVIYPYFFLQVVSNYFIFFIMVVTENLRTILKVLEKIHKMRKVMKMKVGVINLHAKPLDDDLLNSLLTLKRIYRIIADTTGLINEVAGFPYMMQLCIMIVGNISAGYKVYLSFMGDIPIEMMGGEDAFMKTETVKTFCIKFQFQYSRLFHHLEFFL